MGILISPAVIPVILSLTWNECSAASAISGSLLGVLSGVVAWISIASSNYGIVNLDTLGREWPMFGGNAVSVAVSTCVCVGLSVAWPECFAWEDMMAVNCLADRAL